MTTKMEKVCGIGGFFFKSKITQELAKWYSEILGVDSLPSIWQQEAGDTILAPFSHDTDYFDRPEQQWMINFRVNNLNIMIEQLKSKNITVITKEEWNSEAGAFARIHDPDGNPIELWEPAIK